jgi:hypothetical protein
MRVAKFYARRRTTIDSGQAISDVGFPLSFSICRIPLRVLSAALNIGDNLFRSSEKIGINDHVRCHDVFV